MAHGRGGELSVHHGPIVTNPRQQELLQESGRTSANMVSFCRVHLTGPPKGAPCTSACSAGLRHWVTIPQHVSQSLTLSSASVAQVAGHRYGQTLTPWPRLSPKPP
jgi:hypothetical protein